MKTRTLLLAALLLGNGLRAASPNLTLVPLAPDSLRLEWTPASDAAVYTVQTRDTWDGGLWRNADSPQRWPLPGTTWTDARARLDAARFYRVVAVDPAVRGRLLAANPAGQLTLAEVNLFLRLAGISLTAQHGVVLHEMIYETIDPIGQRVQASGVLVLPDATTNALPLLSYQHGTLAERSDAPSLSREGEVLVGVAMAAGGYASVLPDYLGLGSSPGPQYYHHATTEAAAAVDLLRATRTFCASQGVPLTGQLFVFGYSHGGHATMALAREIETFHNDEFALTAAAPMAGAYDLSGVTANDVLSGRPMPSPYYFALLLASYQAAYRLAESLSDWLVPPYDRTLPPLLDGYHSSSAINAAMPSVVTNALKPSVVRAMLTNPNHPLRLALQDNDVYRWKPRTPMRLYHCRADQDVIFANSQVALQAFHMAGATQVELVDVNPNFGHGACSIPSMMDAKTWFDSFRR